MKHVDPATIEPMARIGIRDAISQEIERLIAMLDEMEGDADLEPDDEDEDTHDREAIDEREDDPAEGPEGDDEREFDPAEAGIADLGGLYEVEGEIAVAEGFRLDRESRKSSVDPALLPDSYFMVGDGNCLDPVIKHGDRVLVSKTEPCRPGDFVAIFFRRRFVRRGEHQVLVKKLIADGRDGSARLDDGRAIVAAEMFNPPKKIAFPAESVAAIHRVLKVDNETSSYRWREGDMLAAAARGLS